MITLDLKEEGQSFNRKTVAAGMQRQGLRAKAAKKFKATAYSNHGLPLAPNVLQQDFTAAMPNQKWVGNITYLWTAEGWLYLAAAAHGNYPKDAGVLLDEGVLHFWFLAKYAATFFSIASSSACSANWRLRRAFSTASCCSDSPCFCCALVLLRQV